MDDRGSIFGTDREFLLFTTASRPILGPTYPSIQWITESLSLGVKRLGREADHSPSCPEVKNAWTYTPTPPYVFIAWYFVKHRANFNLTKRHVKF